MSIPTASRPTAPPMLSAADRHEATQVAQRLFSAVRELLAKVPFRARSATAMARHLKVERTVVQRLLSTFASANVDANALVRTPGPKALIALADAMRGAELAECAELFESATLQLEGLFARLGGTQRAFAERLLIAEVAPAGPMVEGERFTPPNDPTDSGLAHRATIFNAARELVGRWSKVQLQFMILNPSKTDPDYIHTARVRGTIGHHWRHGTPPLMFLNQRRADDVDRDFGFHPLAGHDNVLREFSTEPLPDIQQVEGVGTLAYVVAPNPENEDPFDLLIADQTPKGARHVRGHTWGKYDFFAETNFPAETLIFGKYIHRDLARMCIPGVDVHLSGTAMTTLGSHRWMTKVDANPQLQVLGTGSQANASVYYPRMSELVAYTFKQMGLDPSEFVGYRCEVQYPAWRMAYRMYFDYQADVSQ